MLRLWVYAHSAGMPIAVVGSGFGLREVCIEGYTIWLLQDYSAVWLLLCTEKPNLQSGRMVSPFP